jgi:hypothetical protein
VRNRDVGHRGRYQGTKKRKRASASQPLEQQRTVTEEEVAQTYTGLDREMAEEFITIAMEPGTGRYRQQTVPEIVTDKGR